MITLDHFETDAPLTECAEESVRRLRTTVLFVGVTRREEVSGTQGTGLVQTMRVVKWPHRLFRAEAYFRLNPGCVMRAVVISAEAEEAVTRAEFAEFLVGMH